MALTLARKPLPKPNPQSDPRFQKITGQLKQGAAKTKAHVPASKKAGDAAKAAKGPPNERLAAGKAKQVDKIEEAKEDKPKPSTFLEILRAEIAKVMPKTLGQTENFDQTAQQMKGGLKGNVAQQKEASTKDVSGASKAAPAPTGEATAGGDVPKEGAPTAPKVDAADGMPAPKSDADVSLQDSKQTTEDQMKEAEVTTPQLQKANDPRFSAVIDAKGQVAQSADTGPTKYRAAEKGALTAAAAGATSATRVSAAAMFGVRGGANARVMTRQQQQKAADEAKRKAVVDRIESIYAATKARVEARLAALDPEVNAMFDSGVDAALNTMTKFVGDKIFDYKLRRYLSIPIVGAARWIKDQFVGLPDEVNAFYEQGRAVFQAAMDNLIVRVAALVERRLKEAKAEVARGQAEIKAFVASQPKDLQQVAMKAQADVTSRFAELESSIEEKKNSLAQSLAQKYKEGFDKANDALKKIQDENKGLVQGFIEKLAEVIKALLEFKAKLMAILKKGADAIKLIIADPIGFLGNLIAAVKGGIQAFVANIWTHLKAGFMKWLFGNLPPGVTIPTDLSLVSIFKLVMGVLGITYEKMRAKAVKLIGNTAVTVIEKLVSYIYTLVTGGPAALWEQVKGDLSTLKGMVIDAIQSWLVETVVKQAIAKIVSIFNPVGAIVQAIIAIYNVVMFVIEKAQQIMAFVESVVNSVYAIATGAIGGAIKWIEQALANTIPIVIGFLARLIGLGGISQKIRDFIMKVQSKVDQAIDKALKVIVDKIKGLFGGGKDKKGKPVDSAQVKANVAADLKGKTISTAADEESLITAMVAKHKPDGLKSIEFVPGETSVAVIVEASLAQQVASLNILKKADFARLKRIMGQMRYLSKKTAIYAFYNGRQVAFISNFPGHTESKLVPQVVPKLIRAIKADLKSNKVAPNGSVVVRFDMTRSPCEGCAEFHVTEVIPALKADPALANLKITADFVAASVTQGSPGEEGLIKLLDPKKGGQVRISASDVWTEIEKQLTKWPSFYDRLSKRHYTPGRIEEYKGAAAALNQDIADIVQQYQSGALPRKKK